MRSECNRKRDSALHEIEWCLSSTITIMLLYFLVGYLFTWMKKSTLFTSFVCIQAVFVQFGRCFVFVSRVMARMGLFVVLLLFAWILSSRLLQKRLTEIRIITHRLKCMIVKNLFCLILVFGNYVT
ncbi:unnamed protein product [Chrysodeixis includens]|uniref:Uncharacterized protein n=1 Tax=Chrysodeixis includens TaxID=689277 RepID=A0A9P0BZC2_CHRIL|nr:unnamed protein product [Chrysodeixis includens]